MPTAHRTRPVAARPVVAVAMAALLILAAACGTSGDDDVATGDDPVEETTTTEAGATEEDGPTETTGDDSETTEPPTGDDPAEPGTQGEVGDRQDYVDAIAGSLTEEGFLTNEQGECLGEGWIDTIGFDRIVDAGITPDQFAGGSGDQLEDLDLGEPEANELYDQFGDCDIDLAQVFLDLFDAEESLDEEQRACVEESLTDDALRASFVADFTGEDDVEDPLSATAECVDF